MVRIERDVDHRTEERIERIEPMRKSQIPAAAVEPTPQRGIGVDPAYQAYWILRIGFVVAPIIAGVDKFFNALVSWDVYLAPWAANIFAGAYPFMYVVGVVEILAGIGVALMPRVFAYIVSAWLLMIAVNLLTIPGYFDIALRDVGLALGALALARLAAVYRAGTERTRGVAWPRHGRHISPRQQPAATLRIYA